MTAIVLEPDAPDRGAPSPGVDHRRPAEAMWMPLAAALIVVTVRLAMGATMDGPRVFPDELGYLAAARHLAGVSPPWELGPAAFYHPGWSVLLVPAFWLTDDPSTLYQSALAVNAVLGGVTLLLLRRVLVVLFAPEGHWATVAALVAGLYPAALLTSTVAWPESLVPTLFLALLLAVRRLLLRPSPMAAALSGAAAVASWGCHPRSLVLVPLVVLLAGALWLGGRARWTTPAAGLAVAGALLGAMALLNGELEATLYQSGFGGAEQGVGRLVGVHEALEVPGQVVRQLWYLAVGTVGMAAVGVLALAGLATRRPWRHAGTGSTDGAARGTAAFALVSLATMVVTSAVFLAERLRFDHLFYGRYNEAFLPLFLAGGVLVVCRADRRRRAEATGVVVVGAAAVAVLGLLARLDRGALDEVSGWVAYNVLALEPLLRWFDGPRILLVTAGCVVGMGVLALAGHWYRALAPLLLVAVFSVSAWSSWTEVLRPDDDEVATLSAFPAALREVTGGEPVGYDWERPDLRAPYAYQWWAGGDLDLEGFVDADDLAGPWALSILSWSDGLARGARVALVDGTWDQALWVMPGPEQSRLAAQGRLLPTPFPGPLPDEAYRATVALADDASGPLRVPAGDVLTLDVEVAHVGTASPWPQGEATGRVRVGGRLAGNDGAVVSDGRGDLDATLLPGQTGRVRLAVDAVDGAGEPLDPGAYELTVDLVQESVTWFADRGSTPLTLEVVVE